MRRLSTPFLFLTIALVLLTPSPLRVKSARAESYAAGAGAGAPIQGSPCFAVDPAIGSTSRGDHLGWAQQQDSTRLMNNLMWKIGILFNCSSVSGDQLAVGFGQMSGIIGDYVSNPACFNNDAAVVGKDRSAHERWARTKTREQVRDNLIWKAGAAMKCLERGNQVAFFADESVALAKIPSSSGGGGSGNVGGGGCPGAAGYSLAVEPTVARPGDRITAHVNVPGGAIPPYAWVGLFAAGGSGNLGQYSYLDQIKAAGYTRIFTAPGAGQYEIRVLLDSGYDKVAVRCNFTVQ